ncbi:Hpt domain-containing protein [Polaromonas sp. CG_23.6]|uniref:Hpt domain-containing protein n=1 Tax=unclassified Polaromonas TaxID=2638319 RepID=UPI0018CADCF4|nr:Hpt domain-containing protein [Polaromonas sp. CG_23.6]MBG6070392.1 chemotaxis protein histidine kinase CheA [Polaromonas sp. CG_9.7]MBG6112390.1 chemotaxis protein histidine kinase CheA [Polaromonas sp. CG_9.2]MDH6184037.1 chemotaxis protein histidine kinase CheA [Polaromonas sp. CG_23.6]
MSITDPSFPAFVELQRADYRAALPQRLAQIELLWHQVLNGDSAVEALTTLERCAHSLAGSGATFGFAGVGNAARDLERTITTLLDTACALTVGTQSQISQAIELLQRSLPGEIGTQKVRPHA